MEQEFRGTQEAITTFQMEEKEVFKKTICVIGNEKMHNRGVDDNVKWTVQEKISMWVIWELDRSRGANVTCPNEQTGKRANGGGASSTAV